jgi:hypothetical protein
MKYWHPGMSDDGRPPHRGRRGQRQLPSGWWILPGIFIGAFLWAGIFLLFDLVFDWPG